MSNDHLNDMWNSQIEFMKLLQKHRNFPQFPIDPTKKTDQKLLKDVGRDCMDEIFEALYLLKNSKNHRKTEIREFDLNHFIEELVDANKFLIEMLVLLGVSKEEYYEHFMKKTDVNKERIEGNY